MQWDYCDSSLTLGLGGYIAIVDSRESQRKHFSKELEKFSAIGFSSDNVGT